MVAPLPLRLASSQKAMTGGVALPTIFKDTALTAEEVLREALRHFGGTPDLQLVEMGVHLHGEEGALQLAVAGSQVVGDRTYRADDVLRTTAAYLGERFGVGIVYLFVHLHAVTDRAPDHVLVRVYQEAPTRVEVESEGAEVAVREFLAGLPELTEGAA